MEPSEEPEGPLGGLNERLRSFLEHVAQLEATNRELEQRILDWGKKNIPPSRDWSAQEKIMEELRTQVSLLMVGNAQLAWQTDFQKSRASHLEKRYEMEKWQTGRIEPQVKEMRKTLKDLERASMFLEREIQDHTTELRHTQEEYEESRTEHWQHRRQLALLCDDVQVQRLAGEDGRGMELSQLLDRIRTQCDRIGTPGSHLDPDTSPTPVPGFSRAPGGLASSAAAAAAAAHGRGGGVAQKQAEAALAQVSQGEVDLKEAREELAEARRQWHGLQVEIESMHALEKGLESSLRHTQQHFSEQLQDLSKVVRDLEGELDGVRGGLAGQRERHSQLLNTKMRLEREIKTYRRLLDSEEGRYLTCNGQLGGLKPWKGPVMEIHQNGLELSPDDAQEPITELHMTEIDGFQKHPAILRRQMSLVILTEPERNTDVAFATVKTQEILQGTVVRESAEGHGTVETEKIDKVIKQWEGSFFQGNPKLRKKSVSLRFDLHMAVTDEGCAQTKQDSLPDVEVRLVMRRSRSIPSIAQ
ncbi:keratin, type I cytoskeletal 18 isoform X2 [Clupea harengus]|nr:keratin, type I cytoskeletal 18 isoform X2 [Clupea harengus]